MLHKRVSYIKIVEKSNQNLKVIKNTLPYKSGNPESLKNNHSSWRFLQVMCTQLARICCGHSTSCFVQGFAFQVISEKTMKKRFYNEFYPFYPFFVLSQKPKTIIKFGARWWPGNENQFCFLFIASRTLIQRYAKFNSL